jgi:Zn finger protein HypA/HybF involved in hydrogenase expression
MAEKVVVRCSVCHVPYVPKGKDPVCPKCGARPGDVPGLEKRKEIENRFVTP